MEQYQIRRVPRGEGGGIVRPIENTDMGRRSNGKIFSHPFTNTCLIAKKASGKTSLIFHIMRRLINKHTVVFIICPSHNGDQAWTQIKGWLDDRDIPYFTYYSPHDSDKGDESSGSESDDEFYVREAAKTKELPIIKSIAMHLRKKSSMWDDNGKRSKTNYLLIIDDCGTETRDKTISNLMRRNRNHRMNIILSVQNATDIMPAAISQIDNAFLSRGNTEEKLQHVHRLLDLPIEYENFSDIYKIATEQPYSFLNIDVRKNKYKRGFEDEIVPTSM